MSGPGGGDVPATETDLELLDVDQLLTPAEAARHAGVKPATIRKWKERGLLKPDGYDAAGHPKYRLIDVARAEYATRARARRT